jgi:hypothetical protein
VLSEIDVSEWGITYKEIRPCKSKRSCDTGKIVQLVEVETRSQDEMLGKRKGKKHRIVKKDQRKVSKPKECQPYLCYNCRQPGILCVVAQNPGSRIRTSEQLKAITARSRAFR